MDMKRIKPVTLLKAHTRHIRKETTVHCVQAVQIFYISLLRLNINMDTQASTKN